ncbi:MAG: hypothetical protein MUF00_20305 [Gemmatimonadaceae bacterium]|jgi:hypothetical protein|nr:hypothetical protein [Gemmatimonadaceae bacterium]
MRDSCRRLGDPSVGFPYEHFLREGERRRWNGAVSDDVEIAIRMEVAECERLGNGMVHTERREGLVVHFLNMPSSLAEADAYCVAVARGDLAVGDTGTTGASIRYFTLSARGARAARCCASGGAAHT